MTRKKKQTTSGSAPSRQKSPSRSEPSTGPQRLQRVMAAAGIGSRRECEHIIEEGRVEVDGQIVTTLGVKVDPHTQKVYVDGQRIVPEKLQYFMLNKPPGVVSTSRDPSGRVRVIDLIKTDRRVYNVGRLDQSSEGLILVTNDGELANRLTHPRYGIQKKYHVLVAGVPSASDLRSLEEGVYLAEGKAKATRAKFLRKVKNGSWIEIVLAEGRNREIRRMLASVGNKVRTLKRVAIGPLKLGNLPVGAHRPLTPYELKMLKRAVDQKPGAKRSSKKSVKKRSRSTPKKKTASGRTPTGSKANRRSISKKGAKKRSTSKRGAARMGTTDSSRRNKKGAKRKSTQRKTAKSPRGQKTTRKRSMKSTRSPRSR